MDKPVNRQWFTCPYHGLKYMLCLTCLMNSKHHLSSVPMARTMYDTKHKTMVKHTIISVEIDRGRGEPEVGGGV